MYSSLHKVVNEKHEIEMRKWRLSHLIFYVKYLKELWPYARGSV